jgi:2,4-dienoyl-CoA reductase-like NADH-dependent reductase (Old Yellow Enzyme family)
MAKSKPRYTRVAQLKTANDFKEHIKQLGIDLPFKEVLSEASKTSLATPVDMRSGKTIGNRFCILPMEGWDGTTDGLPSELTKRRWHNFAISGAKLLWGCEAVAVRPEGRANPNQLMMNPSTHESITSLYQDVLKMHSEQFGTASDLEVGLQLTHSGRFARPEKGKPGQPIILYHHSVLDKKMGLPEDYPLMSDDDIDRLVEDFVKAAEMAAASGFNFVDIKHCHGYLGHEFLSAFNRPGKYGGGLEGRTKFLRSIVEGIRSTSNIPVGVRLSAFDWMPYKQGSDGIGQPFRENGDYSEGFGCDSSGCDVDYHEIFGLFEIFRELGIEMVCITGGSPYYVPHIQRPALFPPSDGYLPPEDPLVGVARQIAITGQIKKKFPDIKIVGSAYSYLQEWLPHVAEAVIDNGMADFIGLGRMVLSYPNMPVDILEGNQLARGKVCRTFSDCTTGPRQGMISGCFPLDPFYKQMPEAAEIKEIKKKLEI